ncbi:MAG: endonuclease V [Acidobacteriota bacterium]
MIAALDADYRDTGATVGCVLFREWTDPQPTDELVHSVAGVAAYESGEFYKRELPVLLAALGRVDVPLDTLVIDGHVWLDRSDRPGLGVHLHRALDERIPVVGVAKNAFGESAPAHRVLRGESLRPLYVTAVGLPIEVAAEKVRTMAGEHRIPTLLKRADALSRSR